MTELKAFDYEQPYSPSIPPGAEERTTDSYADGTRKKEIRDERSRAMVPGVEGGGG